MTARRQRLIAATVKNLVEALLASKDALTWRPKTRQEFARILRVEAEVVELSGWPPAGDKELIQALRDSGACRCDDTDLDSQPMRHRALRLVATTSAADLGWLPGR